MQCNATQRTPSVIIQLNALLTMILQSQSPPIFMLCDNCYWCATYFDKGRLLSKKSCPQCKSNNNELSSFPIISNESFILDHDFKRRIELEFKPTYRQSEG